MSGQRPPSPLPPQPQPFRFWLPYRSNVGMGSWRQQPRPPPPSQPLPSSPRSQLTTPPPPTPAGPTPPRRSPPPHAVVEDIPLRGESSDESDTIPVENSYSSQLRGGRPSVADLELTLSGEPPRTTGREEQSSGRALDGNRGNDTTKIAISGFPRTRLFDGARAPYRREIEDGIKSLAAAARERETPRPPESGQGYRVVTLAGHNVGASMVVGHGNAPPPETPDSTTTTARVATNVNSNVQSVNNSSMEGSTLSAGSPGVHVDIKNAREEEETEVVTPTPKEEDKPKELVRRPPLVVSRPARRRRCLRALMMENGSDTEAARKPRPGACRFQCVADHAPPTPATASNGGGGGGGGGGAAEDGGKSSAEEATR
ncbi:hypothetical protein HU200_066834 [Digitaria exilis]|uniref:Uncharacterized protein n=1 Tax=Digitaria exilis TaxID=1010633 RepID=A0A835A0E3_9POAL|nr:hypothetical protein HU200_066834 [Digitaria exilis]